MDRNIIHSVNLSQEAYERLLQIREIVEDMTCGEFSLDQICSTLICQVELYNYEKTA